MPFFFLAVGLLLTFSFFRSEVKRHEQNQKTYYREQLNSIRENIEYRLQTYVDEQIAAAAFISASQEVTRLEWRHFVTALKLDINYPGINGLGFAVPVNKKDSLAFVHQLQQENMPWFGISGLDQSPNAPDYFVVKFIEPQYRNRQALGFDMGSELVRRSALEKARDKGIPTLTGKIVLVQDQRKTPGFNIYVPVYKPGGDTLKSQFLGWTYAPFIAKNFMDRVLAFHLSKKNRPYEIALYDGKNTDEKNLLYKSWIKNVAQNTDQYEVTFPVYNSRWSLRLTPSPDLEWNKDLKLAYFILVGGILLSVLVFFLMRSLATTRQRALALAEKMTGELRALNQNLDHKVDLRTRELDAKNKQLSDYAENLKNSYEDLEVKVKFRNLQLEKQVKALQEENTRLKNNKA